MASEDGTSYIEPASEGSLDGEEEDGFGATSDYDPTIDAESMMSISTSIYRHSYEHGRRYHMYRYGTYPIPNDEHEGDREELKHVMLKELLKGKLILAPITDDPQKIVDLGTGFGEWAIEVADLYPSAQVIGLDLSPVQPQFVPPNCRFIVDDIEVEEWAHGDDIDYAHIRFTANMLKDASGVARTMLRNLKPGGWLEWQEINPRIVCDDGTVTADYPLNRFYEILKGVWEGYGFDLYVPERLRAQMEAMGYVHVHQRVFHVPLGAWPRDHRLRLIGMYLRECLTQLLPAMGAKPFREAGVPPEEADRLFADIRAAFMDRRIHARLQFFFVYGQKPMT